MSDAITPMMQQYRRVRGQLPSDTILFFRLGDFYEMFFEDAKTAAPILDITLTRRNGVPMCGVPYHAVDGYLSRLIRAGKKVAICDQMENPAEAKGIVRRELTGIVTPGTVLEGSLLDAAQHNYLAGVCACGPVVGLAMLDLLTGSFWIEEAETLDPVLANLQRFPPGECVMPEAFLADPVVKIVRERLPALLISPCEDWSFDYGAARDALMRQFGVASLDGYGCEGRSAAVGAAGGILHYVREVLRRDVRHVCGLRLSHPGQHLMLDEGTCRNLDLVSRGGRGAEVALLGVLDVTRTAMGGRLLREWLLRPLMDPAAIGFRHEAVGTLVGRREELQELREVLGSVRDLERLIARLAAGSGNARDLRALGESLAVLPLIQAKVAKFESATLREAGGSLQPLPSVVDEINRAIVDEPPLPVRDGNMIRSGYHSELDALRTAASEGRQWLAEYQAREQERTGIRTLKVRNNKVLGFYLEVSRSQAAHVPEEYIRKQTLSSGERYITLELKDYENRILGAQERAVALEYELFAQVREAAVAHTADIQNSASALAELDVLAALADRALMLRYVRPRMTSGDRVCIRGGRHPIVEQMPDADRFVPNDTLLNNSTDQVLIITGPNMAGKSTYIRQVALIVIMAQIGSFVPAAEAEIGVVDRIFTRVGASDDLSRGRSTFMVEMQETANILNNATPRSLVVLDEIGRGTSTFDGISIAWAVAEYLHGDPRVKAKTLFATHYHELTDLALTLSGVRNYNVLVREQGERVVFLRRIVAGAADKSYGIQVARLAGLPPPVIERAKEILSNLEDGEFGDAGQPKIARHPPRRRKTEADQLSLFGGGESGGGQ